MKFYKTLYIVSVCFSHKKFTQNIDFLLLRWNCICVIILLSKDPRDINCLSKKRRTKKQRNKEQRTKLQRTKLQRTKIQRAKLQRIRLQRNKVQRNNATKNKEQRYKEQRNKEQRNKEQSRRKKVANSYQVYLCSFLFC